MTRRRKFYWGWVLVGLIVMVGLHVLAYFTLGARIVALVDRDPVSAFGAAGSIALGIYFIGGLVVGRLSPGKTIQEPAVAGVIGIVVLFGLQLLVGMVNVFGLLVGAPFCFGMAYFGGWVGEQLQSRAARRSGGA